MKKLYYKIIGLVLLGLPTGALAQIDPSDTGLTETASSAGYGESLPTLTNIIAGIINAFLGIIGIVLVILLIYGGVMWMTASGSPDQLKKAKAIIVNAVVGLIIVVAAYAIALYVTQALVTAVTTT